MGSMCYKMVKGLSNKKVFIFPGQGAQYVGMGKDISDSFKSARNIFKKADNVLGYNLSKICFEGPLNKLSSTEISQPAILTVSIACLYALKEVGFKDKADFYAGLSLGEYSALVASGAIDFEEAVKLVAERGKFMHKASLKNPGKMACILGLSIKEIESIASASRTEIANINCPHQVVISGKEENIKMAKKIAEEKGAKRVIILNISGPFHSQLMDEASLMLASRLEKTEIKKPQGKVIFNVTAKEEDSIKKIGENLAYQVNHTTYWQRSIEYISDKGDYIFFEIGPSQVLKGLLKRINPQLKVYNVGRLEDIEIVRRELMS